jgi:hypothetical protein
VPATVVELDTLADGDAVQAGVAEVTGRRTVPQVFIGGKHVGGCDGEFFVVVVGVRGRDVFHPSIHPSIHPSSRTPTCSHTKQNTYTTDTVAAHKSGKLKEMLAGVGIAV